MKYVKGNKMPKILIVEDEINISSLLKTHLEREGYQCFQAFDGITALEEFNHTNPALVILDLMLPRLGGLEVCKAIRGKSDTYILMLTAKQEEIDKVLGLEMGADDYMIKPFSIRELLARVKVLMRRPHLMTSAGTTGAIGYQTVFTAGNLLLNPTKMEVTRNGKVVLLTALEFDLLHFLMKNKGIVFTRDHLLERIWGENSYVYDRSIDRIISQLRKKVEEDPEEPKKILTIWGVGYKFDENA
jgi:two-component system, OmpR family, response regulator VicR